MIKSERYRNLKIQTNYFTDLKETRWLSETFEISDIDKIPQKPIENNLFILHKQKQNFFVSIDSDFIRQRYMNNVCWINLDSFSENYRYNTITYDKEKGYLLNDDTLIRLGKIKFKVLFCS